ncbi:hypothetical protein [Laspinema olomoucense]|nr:MULTISPECIES: hypothetical protein [unclassified Laspinema]
MTFSRVGEFSGKLEGRELLRLYQILSILETIAIAFVAVFDRLIC